MCCSAAVLRDPRGTLFVSARGRAPTRQQRVSWAVSRRRSSRYRSLQVPGVHSAAGCTYGAKSASARRAGRTKPMRKNRSEQAPPMEQELRWNFKSPARRTQSLSVRALRANLSRSQSGQLPGRQSNGFQAGRGLGARRRDGTTQAQASSVLSALSDSRGESGPRETNLTRARYYRMIP